MGTNYYAVKIKPSVEEPIHIGKLSYGWRFLFQEQEDTWRDVPVIWHSYPQVIDWLKKYTVDDPQYVIINEYDEIIDLQEFVDLVESKQSIKDDDTWSKIVDGYRFEERWFQ